MAREFPRPTFSGDYLAGSLIITASGRTFSGTVADYITVESLPVPGGLVADTVYEVVWLGDTDIAPTPTVWLRMGATYGNGNQNQSAVLFEDSWTATSPLPMVVAPFVCPSNFDSVTFLVQIKGNGSFSYGSAPGGLLFAVRPVGNLENINIITV